LPMATIALHFSQVQGYSLIARLRNQPSGPAQGFLQFLHMSPPFFSHPVLLGCIAF
jgi:hypothetical protein